MPVCIYQVDAFTREPFRGNPAGVCVLEQDRADAWMQHVAAEMNLSETAFVRPEGDRFRIRYFTPLKEVPLCGHATLASAHVLWETGRVDSDQSIAFRASAGDLGATREDLWICLDFPNDPVSPVPLPTHIDRMIGVRPLGAHRGRLNPYLLLELQSEAQVRQLDPDLAAVKKACFGGLMVTARGEAEGVDFVSRFFAPDVGIDEDPVTGSSHCNLTPYWAERLGKTEMSARQLSRRGGDLRVRLRGDRVHILGQAVTVLRSNLLNA